MTTERIRTALDDIVAVRCPGISPLAGAIIRSMVMDVLYAKLRSQMREEIDDPRLDPILMNWSVELAARTQLLMDTHGVVRAKQREYAEIAKPLAEELMQRFATNVLHRVIQ